MRKIIVLLIGIVCGLAFTISCKQKYILSTNDLGRHQQACITVDTLYYKVEENAKLPRYKEGANHILKAQIEENLKYPITALESGIQGRTILSFEIGANGQLTGEVKKLYTTDRSIDTEIIRAMQALPNDWEPSLDEDGFRTSSEIIVNIRFVLK